MALWQSDGKIHPTLFPLNVSDFIRIPCFFSSYLAVYFCGSNFDHIFAHRQRKSVPVGLSSVDVCLFSLL